MPLLKFTGKIRHPDFFDRIGELRSMWSANRHVRLAPVADFKSRPGSRHPCARS